MSGSAVSAAFQENIDAAVSKTINLPSDAPSTLVRDVFNAAARLRLKGATVYRYGSRPRQVLSLLEPESSECRGARCSANFLRMEMMTMAQCLLVFERNRKYHRIPDAEVEDWDEVLEELDGEPQLIERVEGWAPYTHAYRLPDGSVYLLALGAEEESED